MRRLALVGLVPLVFVLAALLAVSLLSFQTRQQAPDAEQDTNPPRDRSAPPLRSVGEPPGRAFNDDSWWNTPLPRDVPHNPSASAILEYLRTAPESGRGCLMLAGAGKGRWGQPIYRARPEDRVYHVGLDNGQQIPELRRLRIPAGARSADNSDGSMTIYDVKQRFVVMLTDASYSKPKGTWRAKGATVTYLDSNGLHVRTGRSDDLRNRGSHRGNNGAVAAVSYDEVAGGAVRHVLKVAAGPELANRWVFPMVGSDGDYEGNDPAIPPQGLRFRLRWSVDLSDLEPEAQVIARTLQTFGFYLGDSGGTTALKLEDTVSEGRGQLWDLGPRALCDMPFTSQFWEVLPEWYSPTTQVGS